MSSSRKRVEECPTGGVGSGCAINANACLNVTAVVTMRYRRNCRCSSGVRRDGC